jgi:hypothetical protein
MPANPPQHNHQLPRPPRKDKATPCITEDCLEAACAAGNQAACDYLTHLRAAIAAGSQGGPSGEPPASPL